MISILSLLIIFGGLWGIILVACCFLVTRYLPPSQNWALSYEWGYIPSSASFDSFSFSFFSLLIFFVVFDLEISLLLNMPEQSAIWSGFFFYFIFLLILVVGFLVEAVTGYVRWGY
uniref:NADH-ubiquinone oxidoreductase chain 3 n=1 Tax=Khawia rossittensis TaxID=1095097 RepID=G8FGZ2_9CEST|nr:NADH dehydrogenase subunit 3 [Khawia rossittensis]